jgi:hypothetical protein
MSVGVGSTDKSTFPELDDSVCGETTENRKNTYCCGPRVYHVDKETVKELADFVTFDMDTRSIEVGTDDKEKLGTYPIEIMSWLKDYSDIKTSLKFSVEITLCQPKVLAASN